LSAFDIDHGPFGQLRAGDGNALAEANKGKYGEAQSLFRGMFRQSFNRDAAAAMAEMRH
jgi:hypothetical protein